MRKENNELPKWWDGRFNLKPPFFLALLVAIPLFFYDDNNFKFFGVCFSIVFIICYIGQIIFRDSNTFIAMFGLTPPTSPHSDICNLCHKVQIRVIEKNCDCGGTFEPLENWKWLNDGK